MSANQRNRFYLIFETATEDGFHENLNDVGSLSYQVEHALREAGWKDPSIFGFRNVADLVKYDESELLKYEVNVKVLIPGKKSEYATLNAVREALVASGIDWIEVL